MKRLLTTGSLWILLALIYSSGAQAYLLDPGTCSTSSVTITRIETTPLDGNNIAFDGGANATQCFGVNDAGAPRNNDDAQGRSSPSPNIGHLENGFLNGEPLANGRWAGPDSALDPYLFIDSPGVDDSPSLSQPHDIPGNASAFDPGWIHLANVNGNGNTTYSDVGTGADALFLGDLLDITWDCSDTDCSTGTWTLETDPNIIQIVQGLLGPNTFDHLAISVFQANKLAIYDFDFTILTQPGNDLFGLIDFVTPYAFTGAWSTNDFGAQGDSFGHVNFWARDPFDALQQVPAPAPLVLLMAGLLALALSSRWSRRG